MHLRLLLIIFLSIPVFDLTSAYKTIRKEILILHSYHKGLSWTDDVERGIRNTLQECCYRAVITTEYMDTKNHFTPEYLTRLRDLYAMKYRNKYFSIIVCSDNNALDFLIRYGDVLFPGVPIVFCGINNYTPAMLRGKKNITGVVEAVKIGDTIRLARKLHPELKEIHCFSDSSTTYRINKTSLKRFLSNYDGGIRAVLHENVPAASIRRILPTLPKESILLNIGLITDKAAGRRLSFREHAQFFRKYASIPMYSMWDFQLGYGIVGGKLLSGVEQGKAAAFLARRILQGTSVTDIPVVTTSPNKYMFDWKELQRFGISRDRLPVGSIVVNRRISFFTRHRMVIIPGSIIFFTLSIFTVFLALSVHKRNLAEKELLEQKNLLDLFFALTPIGAVIVSQENEVLYINNEFTNITGYHIDEIRTPDKWFTAFYPDPDYRNDLIEKWEADKSEPQKSRQLLICCKDGNYKSIDCRVAFLEDGSSLMTMADITKRVDNEKKIKSSLAEKEVLLREIHHRVKNNLQIISSLLSMQHSRTEDPTAAEALLESKQRVYTMSMIHEELYNREELSGVDLANYLPRLIGKLISGMGSGKKLQYKDEVESILLPLDIAIPCGLIVNEVVTNIIKHAFPRGGSGLIQVKVKRDNELIRMTIADNGSGFPDGFHPEESTTLGMQLIHALARQLEADLRWFNEDGGVVLLDIPFAG